MQQRGSQRGKLFCLHYGLLFHLFCHFFHYLLLHRSAYVEFMRKEAADNALSLDGTSFMSRILKVGNIYFGWLICHKYLSPLSLLLVLLPSFCFLHIWIYPPVEDILLPFFLKK